MAAAVSPSTARPRSRSRRATLSFCRRRRALPCRASTPWIPNASNRRLRPHKRANSATARAGDVPTCASRRLLRLRLARCGAARVAAAGGCACARRRSPCRSGAIRWRGIARDQAGPRPRAPRLVEVMLIEALRSTPGEGAPPGLLRGLADARIAKAIRQMHLDPARPWTVVSSRKRLRSRARRSSSVSRAPWASPRWNTSSPGAWRSRRTSPPRRPALAEVAERVGYSSASTFSTAFSRCVGQPPSRYAARSVWKNKPPASRTGPAEAFGLDH